MGLTAFIFPGQGAQYVGMGKHLWDDYPTARRVFEKADDVLGFSISKLCFEGPEDKLKETAVTQPAILTVSAAYLAVLAEMGIRADIAAGLSLGEYGALLVGNVLGEDEAIPLVHKRGIFMQEAVPLGQGAMAAILGLDAGVVEEMCYDAQSCGVVEVANYNCPGQVVIAGEVAAVERAAGLCKKNGARRAVMLPVSAPFHCAMLLSAGMRLSAELSRYSLRDSNIPIIANVNARPQKAREIIRANLIRQVSFPVRFEESLRAMVKLGVTRFIEVGPGKSLSAFVKKTAGGVDILCADNPDDFVKLLKEGEMVC